MVTTVGFVDWTAIGTSDTTLLGLADVVIDKTDEGGGVMEL